MNTISFIRFVVSLDQQSLVTSEMSSFEEFAEIFEYSESLYQTYLWDWS